MEWTPQGRIHAFAEAVDELSVAFAAMDGRQKPKQQDHHLDILAQEITGKLCADCDGCVVCLEQQKPDFWIKIRRMLQAVAQHSTKEEIFKSEFYGRVSALFRDGGRGNLGFFPVWNSMRHGITACRRTAR